MVYERLFYQHDHIVNRNHPGYQSKSRIFADRGQGTFPWDGSHYFSNYSFSDSLSGQAFKNISINRKPDRWHSHFAFYASAESNGQRFERC
jgi:hypothetical protein